MKTHHSVTALLLLLLSWGATATATTWDSQNMGWAFFTWSDATAATPTPADTIPTTFADEMKFHELWEAGQIPIGSYAERQAVSGSFAFARNKSTGTLNAGDTVLWDGTSIEVIADTTGAASMTVAESLRTVGGPNYLVCTLGTDATGTITITGQTYLGETATIVTTFTEKTTVKIPEPMNYVTTFGTDVTSTTITAVAYPFGGITVNAADDSERELVAGVIVYGNQGITDTTVADNEQCTIQTRGFVRAKCLDVAVVTGDKLATDSSGGSLDETSAVDNTVIAIALEPCITVGERIWVYLQ